MTMIRAALSAVETGNTISPIQIQVPPDMLPTVDMTIFHGRGAEACMLNTVADVCRGPLEASSMNGLVSHELREGMVS